MAIVGPSLAGCPAIDHTSLEQTARELLLDACSAFRASRSKVRIRVGARCLESACAPY